MFSNLSQPIEFQEGFVYSLFIENQTLFRTLLEDLYNQTNKFEGFCVLSVNNTPIEIDKYVELITSYVPFDINQKRFLNKILGELEKLSLDATNYLTTQQIIADIEKYIDELSFDLGLEIELSKLTFSNLLKSVGILISEDYEQPLENLLNFFDIVLDLDKDKLFITVNLRSYYNDQELKPFINTVINKKIKLLMIETYEHPLLDNESRTLIDSDLCEI
jgi:CRISPR-associated protein Csn2